MKKVISLLIAVLLMACAVVSVSAEISPTAPIEDKFISIDAISVPDKGGTVTPDINNPVRYEIGEDGTVTLVASSLEGFKFSYWQFISGEFDIIEGSLTTSTIVILPTGPTNIRAEAHFEEITTPVESEPVETEPSVSEPVESEPVETEPTETQPESKPIYKPDTDTQSPTTGQPAVTCIATAVILVLGFVIIALKKKAC